VLDRQTFAYLGSFKGELVANTDGVGLTREPSARFPEGAFYAVHNDQGISAFDLHDIATAVGLDAVCPE
jgi:3-phytase